MNENDLSLVKSCCFFFFPRLYSFKHTYSKIYAALYNRLVHYGKIPVNYAATVLEPIQNIGKTQFGKPHFPLSLEIKRNYKL